MNEKMMRDRFVELDNDKAFIEELSMCESIDDVVKLYASKGLEFTPGEIEKLADLAYARVNGTELGESELVNVSGGFGFTAFAVISYTILNIAAQGTAYALCKFHDSYNSKWK